MIFFCASTVPTCAQRNVSIAKTLTCATLSRWGIEGPFGRLLPGVSSNRLTMMNQPTAA